LCCRIEDWDGTESGTAGVGRVSGKRPSIAAAIMLTAAAASLALIQIARESLGAMAYAMMGGAIIVGNRRAMFVHPAGGLYVAWFRIKEPRSPETRTKIRVLPNCKQACQPMRSLSAKWKQARSHMKEVMRVFTFFGIGALVSSTGREEGRRTKGSILSRLMASWIYRRHGVVVGIGP